MKPMSFVYAYRLLLLVEATPRAPALEDSHTTLLD